MCPSPEVNGNGAKGHTNGANGNESHEGFTQVETTQTVQTRAPRNPYSNVGDFLSNVSRFKIIESTLREGEQFANAFFDTAKKIEIAKALDEFGVDYILTHIRCHMDDARIAVETGVDGVDVVIGTSSYLREHSHGKDMTYITKVALEVITFVKSKDIEVRFSTEDSFRSELVDLLSIYSAVDKIGVDRVGIADTVGCAAPRQVYDLVRTLRGVVSCDIECHMHNDTGCAISNAYCALEAGATHVDTSVLGIGERNGITPLGGLMARMIAADRDYVKSKYDLKKLKDIEELVAEAVEVNVPFNNYITGVCAFTHKAGIHAKAILNNPSTYEIINPADFGLTRYVHFTSRLTGWNAIKSRAEQLDIKMTDNQYKACTLKIKAMADIRPLKIDDADSIIRAFHFNLKHDANKPLLQDLTPEEKEKLEAKERELLKAHAKRTLDEIEPAAVTNGQPLAKKAKDEVAA
ncbi:MAG: Saccharopine dehydrogenase [Vezdaea aestivalis]|nr:MAG: Saccharopine dehydrogenase [Vezdaea aestivalis]